MSDSWSEEFIGDYIDGRLSQAERDRFELHLNDHPRDAEIVEEFLQIRADLKNQPGFQLDDQFASRVLQTIAQPRVDESVESLLPSNGKTVSKEAPLQRNGWKSVVAIIGTVAATLLIALFTIPLPKSPVASSVMDEAGLPNQPSGDAAEESDQEDLRSSGQFANDDRSTVEKDGAPGAPASSDATESMQTPGIDSAEKLMTRKSLGASQQETTSGEERIADSTDRRSRANVAPSTAADGSLMPSIADQQPLAVKESENAGAADDEMEALEDQPELGADDAGRDFKRMAKRSSGPVDRSLESKYTVVAISTQLTVQSAVAIRSFEGILPLSESALVEGQSGRPFQLQTNDQANKLKGNPGTTDAQAEKVVKPSGLFQGEKVVDGSTVFALQATELEMKQLLSMLDGETVSLDQEQMAEVIRQFELKGDVASAVTPAAGGGGGGRGFGGAGDTGGKDQPGQKSANGQESSEAEEMREDAKPDRQEGNKRNRSQGGRDQNAASDDFDSPGKLGNDNNNGEKNDDETPATGGRSGEVEAGFSETDKAAMDVAESLTERRTWLLVVKPLESTPLESAPVAPADRTGSKDQ